jgi:arsenite methyltransferase
MLNKARHNALKSNLKNVDFVQSNITQINLPDGFADVVISNCVINLVPHAEKHKVFGEMHRLLKPGGRVAVSDILTRKPLPEELKRNVALYVGCIAGASSKEEYEAWLGEAGFEDVVVVDAGSDLNVYTRGEEDAGCCGGEVEEKIESMGGCCGKRETDGGVVEDMRRELRDMDLNEWAGKRCSSAGRRDGLGRMLTIQRVIQDLCCEERVRCTKKLVCLVSRHVPWMESRISILMIAWPFIA